MTVRLFDATRTKPTQVERLVRYLRDHPGATGLEIVTALSMPKYTSRISDARAQGIDIECQRRDDGRRGYYLRVPEPVTAGETVPLW